MKEDLLDIESILMIYRFSALIFLGVVYLIGFPEESMSFKVGLFFGLFIKATVFNYLYKKYRNKEVEKKVVLVLELMLLSLVLYYTGGKDSPFIGYSITPILLSTTLGITYFPWLLLTFFLTVTVFFSVDGNTPLLQLEFRGIYYAIILILITLGAQLYHHIITKLSEQKRTMKNYISLTNSLYESLDAFSKYNSPQEIINLFTSYTKKITKAPKAITYITIKEKEGQRPFYCVRGSQSEFKEEVWLKLIREFHMKESQKSVQVIPIEDPKKSHYVLVKVQTNTNFYGVLSAFYLKDAHLTENIKAMEFLAKLCGEVLDKHDLETAALNFELSREKDRIANEIHDNVTQSLFGLIYGLEDLKNERNINKSGLKKVELLQTTAQNSIRELRKAIYQISTTKKNIDVFIEEIREYLFDLQSLHKVSIDFSCSIPHTSLNGVQQNAIYRILRESTGNAIRHGKADRIKISIGEHAGCFEITIEDNGKGFRPQQLDPEESKGIGLINMEEIARSLGGKLSITSEIGKGTLVRCVIALKREKSLV